MITIESSESVARPPADVFAFVSDMRKDPQWHTDILEARLTSGDPVVQGSTFAIRFKPFMGRSEGEISVAEYEPPRRIVLRGRIGPAEPTISYTIDPQDGSSRVTRRVEMEPTGLLRLMAPFMSGMMRKRNAGFLANLKRVMER